MENYTEFHEHEWDSEHNHSHITNNYSLKDEDYYWFNISGEKWIAMLSLTLVSMFFGIFPYLLFSYYRQVIKSDSKLCKIILAALSGISGGVLLATTMIHILPEVREKVQVQEKNGASINSVLNLWGLIAENLPKAEILMLYGFCMIYGLEEIAQLLLLHKAKAKRHNKGKNKHHHHHQHGKELMSMGVGRKLDLECGLGDKFSNLQNRYVAEDECQHQELITPTTECNKLCDSPISIMLTNTDDDSTNASSSSTSTPSPNHTHSHVRGSVLTLNNIAEEIETPMGALRSLVSLLALSFHAIMEGIAVGVQNSGDLWITFGAIMSHKCIIALCLGMEMVKSNMRWRMLFSSIFLFSIVSPLGILIGSVMSSGEFASAKWVIVVEGLASGTLLFIVFFEILKTHDDEDVGSSNDSQFSDHSYKESKISIQGILRFVGAFLGVLLAGYLLSLTAHNHDLNHDHGHEH